MPQTDFTRELELTQAQFPFADPLPKVKPPQTKAEAMKLLNGLLIIAALLGMGALFLGFCYFVPFAPEHVRIKICFGILTFAGVAAIAEAKKRLPK